MQAYLQEATSVPLRLGSVGPAVEILQQALAAAGFGAAGGADGRFGGATAAMLVLFQTRHGLVADGVAGPATWAALAANPAKVSPLTLADVTRMFPATPASPIERNLPDILTAFETAGLDDPRMLLVGLATIRAEAECFMPVEEVVSDWNTSPGGHPFDLYDRRPGLGNRGAPDGATFRGRGYVQLTGRRNYLLFGPAAGVAGLEENPALACDPGTAADLLAAFIKAREKPIATALLSDDLARARKLVNGGEHGLRRFTDAYRRGERLLGLA